MAVEWLTPSWPVPANVRALSTLRGGGASAEPYASLNLGSHVQDAPAAVTENRRRLRAAAELPAEPAWLDQIHGVKIADLDSSPVGVSLSPADGAITRVPGRVCAILTADCLPVLIASEAGDAVAAAHAGWRGLAGGVLEAAVRALDVAASSLLVWLGPAIGPGHAHGFRSELPRPIHGRPPGARPPPARASRRYPDLRGSRMHVWAA
jgi:hypothetical protein